MNDHSVRLCFFIEPINLQFILYCSITILEGLEVWNLIEFVVNHPVTLDMLYCNNQSSIHTCLEGSKKKFFLVEFVTDQWIYHDIWKKFEEKVRENSDVFFLFFMKKVVNGIYQERYWTTQHIISQENKTAKLAVKNHEFLPKKKKDSTLPKVTVSKTCQSTWFSQSDTKKYFWC